MIERWVGDIDHDVRTSGGTEEDVKRQYTFNSLFGGQGQSDYNYDAVGNRTSLTGPVGNTTTWAYDGIG